MLRGMSRYLITADDNNRRQVQLRADGGFGAGRNQNANAGSVFRSNTTSRGASQRIVTDARFEKNVLDDFIDYQNNDQMRAIARDMFFHDPISGTVVQTLSRMPFSDFEVAAVPEAQKEKHIASLNAMHMRDMLPEIAQEMYVEGKHISQMNWDAEKQEFTGIIPYDPAVCDLTYLPIYGRDPLVSVRMSNHLRQLATSTDARVQKELDTYADDVKDMLKNQGSYPVPAEYLLYVANRAFSYMPAGVSAFRRIAVVWLYEKNLARGTLDMSSRRQKALLHATLGDDEFIPTNQQLADVGQMIADAERNPVGSMIVTRPGLDIQEVLSNGSDIWRWDEAYDFFTTTKLRGFGLSDSIFGDFNVQEAENTLSSVIEMMSDTRTNITNRVLTQRIGLTVAVKNDFRKARKELSASDHGLDFDPRFTVSRRTHRILTAAADDSMDAEFVNPDDYELPQYRYTKVLRLVSNSQLFENLNTLTQQGLPVPLRILAASLGQSVDEIVSSYDEDIKIRQRIKAYQDKLPKPPAAPDGGGGSGGGSEDSSIFEGMDFTASDRPNRNFDHIEVRDPQTRRILSRKGRQVWDEQKNRTILEAAERVRDIQIRQEKAREQAAQGPRRFHHSR